VETIFKDNMIGLRARCTIKINFKITMFTTGTLVRIKEKGSLLVHRFSASSCFFPFFLIVLFTGGKRGLRAHIRSSWQLTPGKVNIDI